MTKTAVILFNLGGPSSNDDIEPFLFNFFRDKNIINLPNPLRYFLAKYISKKRSRNESRISYGLLGGKSPLLENTQKQAEALEKTLGEGFKVFISMRYWHPMSAQVVKQVQTYNPEEIILLPLYPQYSTTTTKSSFEDWYDMAQQAGLDVPTRSVCCYADDKGFVDGSIAQIKPLWDKHKGQVRKVLFSAHGLPEKIINAGDPYQLQCEQTAEIIATDMGLKKEEWQICYQSRVGSLKWIGPSVEQALKQAAQEKCGVIIYPHSFVSEHVETLVELDIEYKKMALDLGLPFYERAQTVGVNDDFIQGLADIVTDKEYGEIS